jgi:hypothetical protein
MDTLSWVESRRAAPRRGGAALWPTGLGERRRGEVRGDAAFNAPRNAPAASMEAIHRYRV